ncbi:MAG: hypothetical protein M9933_17945 [Chitinophagaceae bacterium]|nr:hypothetical protein [Chitinophagaceae bacterium]
MMAQFKPLVIKSSPLVEMPDYNKPSRFRPHPPHADATWLKPKLVCEITFTEITEDGVFRHPSFEGMREDKAPADVVTEQEQPIEKVTVHPAATGKKKNAVRKMLPPAHAGAKKDIASKLIATPGDGT